MFKRVTIVSFVLAAGLAVSDIALAQVETVVVTASKRERYNDEDDDAAARRKIPYIAYVKRADHVFAQVRVTCDTREKDARIRELKATLRSLIKTAAGTPTISLGVRQGNVLVELKEANFDKLIGADSRTDTSRALVEVKSAVSATDTFDDVTVRIEAFVEKTTKTGRTEILLDDDDYNLTIVGPEQYRDALLGLIAANAKHTAEAFGGAHTPALEGLENPIAWYQKGPLDLGLYIPYKLKVEPVKK